MNYLHLPGTREDAANWNFVLGIGGFRFADLNRVRKLMVLDALFLEEVEKEDPALIAKLKKLRACGGKGIPELELSETLIAAAAYLGPFIARLFHIEAQ